MFGLVKESRLVAAEKEIDRLIRDLAVERETRAFIQRLYDRTLVQQAVGTVGTLKDAAGRAGVSMSELFTEDEDAVRAIHEEFSKDPGDLI